MRDHYKTYSYKGTWLYHVTDRVTGEIIVGHVFSNLLLVLFISPWVGLALFLIKAALS